jgi:hypothetical protein
LVLSTCIFAAPGAVGHAGSTDGRRQTRKHRSAAMLDHEFKIKYGQELTIKGEGLKVKFDSLAEDSRCPTGVNCVWEGDAKILVGVSQGSPEATSLELHTNGKFAKSGKYQQYVITLVALDPYPKADVKKGQREYVATLLITKAP